jgi:hypothetical protein
MKRLEVSLYNGFIFDQGYAPFSLSYGLTQLPNQIFIGRCESLGHEILEIAFQRKIKGRGHLHCEDAGCILNEISGNEICADHQSDYNRIKHIPFEISVDVHGAGNGIEMKDIDSYLKGFRELTGLKVSVVHFRRIEDDCRSKYLLVSEKYCRLTEKFRESHNSSIYRLLPVWFVEEHECSADSESDAYLFPMTVGDSTETPVNPEAFRRFINDGLRRGFITKEDAQLRKKILSRRIIFGKALYQMIRDDEMVVSDDSKRPIAKEEAMGIEKRVIGGYANTLGLLEEILRSPIPPIQLS